MKSRSGTDVEESPSSPEGYVSESDSQVLRTLSEEIAREFAPRLEQTTLVLYDRDPEHLQAQWYVTPQALAEARCLFPGNGTGLRQVLRLCRLDQDGETEVVASTPQGPGTSEGVDQYDFALRGDGAEYICELGLESDTGGWLLLARSNRVRLGDPHLPASRITPVPDDARAQDTAHEMTEGPDKAEDIFVEPALAAVGEPLHPVFPNLEPDDAPPPEHSALSEKALGRTQPRDGRLESPPGTPQGPALSLEQDGAPPGRPAPSKEVRGRARPGDRKSEYPLGIPPYPVSYRESSDAPSPGRPTLPVETPRTEVPQPETPKQETPKQEPLGQAGSRDRKPEYLPGVPPYPAPYLELGNVPPAGRPAPPEKALGQAGPGERKSEYPPGIPPYLMSYRESGDAPPGHSAPLAEAPTQARPEDRRPEFPSSIPHDLTPYPEMAAEFPPGVPVEAALAAVGEPLYPVFPNLELDDSPLSRHSEQPPEGVPGRAWSQDQSLEFPSGVFQYPAPYPEAATDLPPGAELVDMPPPLLPSSPELGTATDTMPGPLYDPRAALSSAVLSTGIGPSVPDMEIYAELIVQGRGAPGSSVDLFGYPIAVGADGRFYIRHPIDISALQPLAAGGGLLSWLEAPETDVLNH